MAAQAADLPSLLGGLYEAALDPALWDGMAPRLAGALGASSAVLKSYRPTGEIDLLEATDNVLHGANDQALTEHWHQNDLWVERSAAHGSGRVVIGHELLPFAELEETGFYRDWLRLLDIHDMVGGVVAFGGGLGVLGIHRDRSRIVFGEDERRAAALLLPHLERALRIRDRLAPAANLAGLTALDHSGLAVMVITGPQRRIRFVSRAAERLLAGAPGLSIRRGCLNAVDPRTESRLAAAVARALANAHGADGPPPPVVTLPRTGRSPLVLSAAPMPERVAVNGEPAVMVLLRDPEHSVPQPGFLQEAFGLTPAEAGVAIALCQGMSPAEIAASFGVGLSTVRTHLKTVMLKTHTSRQAELVALLLKTAAGWTA